MIYAVVLWLRWAFEIVVTGFLYDMGERLAKWAVGDWPEEAS